MRKLVVRKPIVASLAAAVALVGTANPVGAADDGYLTPQLDVSGFTVDCVDDVPYIVYDIQPIGFEWPGSATLTIFDVEGNLVDGPFDVDERTGQILYPGAEIDDQGNPVDFPGWELNADGFWVRDRSDEILREGLDVLVEVNPQATINIRYPEATPECLDPPDQGGPGSIDVSAFSDVCINDTPFVEYDVRLVGVSWPGSAKLTFFDVNGAFVEEQVVTRQSGRVLYPGAKVDANGNPIDWPGWKQLPSGLWQVDDSDAILREGLRIRVEVNPTAVATVGYPPATPACSANPRQQSFPPATPGGGALVRTGSNVENVVRLAVVALTMGLLALVATRRRRLDA